MNNLSMEERKLMELFEPDALLEGLFYERQRGKDWEGERMLMFSILKDAIECFQKNLLCAKGSKGRHEFLDAKEWIFEKETGWLFSFQNICEVWGIDPQYLRQHLTRWKEKRLAGENIARLKHARDERKVKLA